MVAFFNNHSPRQVLRDQNTFGKKISKGNAYRKIIEFAWREHGPPGRTCTPTTGYFYDKTKILKDYLRVDCFILFY